ncbi:unnamed protein product [Polarella glacialis]|uniref:Uncharacterized protein n=1 Tax=Polarella glacialis TaxID=89957 RepID=A0A813K4P5_POLGL|nr:unnamed protein product [Polarella glacialis]
MGVRSLGPQFVWTGELHRSFAKALAGHVGLEPVFCCASLSGSQLEDLVPQMQDQVSRQSSSSQRAWLLGLARRSKGLPKLQKKNLNMGEVQDADTPPLHALYLLAPERHMRLAAISAEFCIASDGLRPARRILWDASYTPEGMLGPGGTGLGACDPLSRAVGLGIWGQHRVNSSSDLRLALVLQTGPTGKLLVADFPASILGPLLSAWPGLKQAS